MKKVFLFLLVAIPVYLAPRIYFLDKVYFVSPVEYRGAMSIRADGQGNGFFASPRNGKRVHRGIDLCARIGAPVFAARSGTVAMATEEKFGMGKYVVLQHPRHMITLYGHLSGINVVKGQFVRQGALIGWVGKTGNANSKAMQPHLHFEVQVNGVPQDPLEYL